MAVFLAPLINDQQENSNGAPLSGGTIEVYLAGSSTPSTTYSDKAGLVPNTWPITLNTLGLNSQGSVWITGGSAYKFIIKDSTGVVQRSPDNISGINDNTIAAADQWVVYQGTPTYISATSFSVAGDQTLTLQVGRRIRTSNTGGTIYSTITGSVYSAPNTTLTVANDSSTLDAGLSAVSYGILSVTGTSLPGGLFNYGQCRLVKSGANLVLQPYQGNRITINGAICVIPSAGVTLAPTGLTVSALYYIYAFQSAAGVLTLEASATGHSTDAATGIEIKTGDATRALVGMARPIAGPAFADTATQRFVVGWFNRLDAYVRSALASNAATTSTSFVASGVLLEFLCWANAAFPFNFLGTSQNSGVNVNFTALSNDSATTAYTAPQQVTVGGLVGATGSAVIPFATDGYHFVAVLIAVGAGTGTWLSGFEGTAQVKV